MYLRQLAIHSGLVRFLMDNRNITLCRVSDENPAGSGWNVKVSGHEIIHFTKLTDAIHFILKELEGEASCVIAS